ncbi:uncharacterized protein CC84DRAFT_1226364 [Paraphaeosphaeria sporulosa]|uniref:Ubiquitin-like protease family profile domain-containing protein n=1 Tax=Paraphaeosphaeria sporulosa TaxID=1460663 RepID=A0A177D000_9PLEO|nr:uncharacterized protein CC84DRAFT_1226364 [Paraphaeosphaeria sporulosa]OAG12269.1 hypothetical protein CC84DRAFT_1226364 [Paraphaeosphaeria sporulosa]
MEYAAPPADGADRRWKPQDVTAHNQRAHAFAQTRAMIRLETESLFVTSSRGFGRELPPTGLARPPLKSRRYTIDASLATRAFQYERDYTANNYDRLPEDLTYPTQFIAKTNVSAREIDERVQLGIQLTLPDPLRYRELHRWGRVLPQFNEDRYPGDDGERRFMNDTYIQFSDGPLRNEDFITITSMTYGSWYRDDVMDAALALCSIYYGAEDNEIMVVGSGTSQAFKFAAMTHGELDMTELRAYAPIFQGKKWILMPLNDGIGETSTGQFHGTHWSLLAINRPSKSAHYIDGYGYSMEKMAKCYACALQKMLDDEEYDFYIEWNSPDQWSNNSTPFIDWGPCGPYVVKIVKIMMAHIRNHQNVGREADITLHLNSSFRSQFDFDSYSERRALEYTIASFEADQVARERATLYANTVLGLPRPLDQAEVGNPTWSNHDAPLFTQETSQCLTLRKLGNYRELAHRQRQHRRHTPVYTSSSSGSSGGISVNSEASGTHRRFACNGAQSGQFANDVEMQERPVSTAVNDDGCGVRIEEFFDNDNDYCSLNLAMPDQSRRSPSLDTPSSSI